MNTLTVQERRKAFTDALRSGEFSQTKGVLQDSRGYCCLGVACVVYEKVTGGDLNRGIYGKLLAGTLPRVVEEFYGFNTDVGQHWNKYGEVCTLSTLNDVRGFTFDQIADVVDSNPEGLWLTEEVN